MDDLSDSEYRLDGDDGARRVQFDWSETLPSTAVVNTVADVSNRDPTEVEPLYEYVDPDALDALITRARSDSPTITMVAFSLADYDVSVYADGEVAVSQLR